MPPAHLIPSLEPKLRTLYDQHEARAARVDWAYHEYLPLDELRADPHALPKLSDPVYLAVETALLTEVNLPWFTAGLCQVFQGALSPLRDFVHSWTAEEDQHAMLLETYLLLGDNGDHRERARLRKQIVKQGYAPVVQDQFEAMAYTAMQELATRAFYLRVAAVARVEDARLARALNRLAKDETLHYAFYRDAVRAHLEVEPNYVEPLTRVMLEFAMPGADMPGYHVRDAQLRRLGIYAPNHFFDMVVDQLWRDWDVPGLNPQASSARQAQKRTIEWHARVGRIAARYAGRLKEQEECDSTERTTGKG